MYCRGYGKFIIVTISTLFQLHGLTETKTLRKQFGVDNTVWEKGMRSTEIGFRIRVTLIRSRSTRKPDKIILIPFLLSKYMPVRLFTYTDPDTTFPYSIPDPKPMLTEGHTGLKC